MTDAIIRHDQQTAAAIAPVDIAVELPQIFQLARALSKATGFIPAHLKHEGEIAAVVLAGRELGLPPMVSLRSLSMVKGKVVLAADVMLGLMIRTGVKVEWLSDGSPAQGNVAKLKLARPGHEPYVSTFSLEDAQRAGLTSNDTYKKHQAAMLRARAVSAGARAYCPDVLSGTYVPGELEEEAAPARTVKPRRSLDDVAVSRESSATNAGMSVHAVDAARHEDEQEHDPVTGEVAVKPYTQDDHIAAFQYVTDDASMRTWVDGLEQFQLTDRGRSIATAMVKKRCAELGLEVP